MHVAVEQELISFSCHLGDLGIVDPTTIADCLYNASLIKDLILQQSVTAQFPDDSSIKTAIHMD